MTDQNTAPRAASQRRNPSTPAAQMRGTINRKRALELADEVAALWVELCQNEPLMVELLLPEELRRKLGELARVTAS